MVRILHLADLHLEAPFAKDGTRSEVSRVRRLALREALTRAGRLAMTRSVDVITIGGDLYEHSYVNADTAQFLVDTFSSWGSIPVLISPGNHDAYLPDSLYAATDWPENVHVFSESTMTPFELRPDFTFWGVAHKHPEWEQDPMEGCDVHDPSGVHIALFHGSELSTRAWRSPTQGPFSALDIHRRGFTLALCGHYHARKIDKKNGLVYPGVLEPLMVDDFGDLGPVLIEVGENSVAYEGIANNRWNALAVNVEVDASLEPGAIRARALDAVGQQLGDLDPTRCIVSAELVGERNSDEPLDVIAMELALQQASAVAALTVKDKTAAKLSVDFLPQDRSVTAEFARALASQRTESDDAEGEMVDDALAYGLSALSGREVKLR